MKVKITEYTGPKECREDITIGGIYKVLNSEDKWSHIYVEDNVGELHAIEKGCFEVIEEEWSGEGLPPVGTVCVTTYDNGPSKVLTFTHVENDLVAVLQRVADEGDIRWVLANSLKPIKSEKQKEIDKIASELLESVNKNGEDFRHFEQPIAEHLYNAGLRFTGEKQ